MIYEQEVPPAKWLVTARDPGGQRVTIGTFVDDNQLALVWPQLQGMYEDVQLTPVEAPPKRLRLARLGDDLDKHYPGGQDHDQSTHGRGGGGDAELRSTNEERLAKYDSNPRPGIDDHPEIVAAAAARFDHFMRRERAISEFLSPVAEATNGQFQHYGERVKFESSIRDKIWREMQADPSLSAAQAAERLTDGNRYTLMWEGEQFRAGHQQAVEAFNRAGWETIADRNAWAPGDDYDGMNYKFAKGDDIVEVQFHTPGSAAIKDEAHALYSQVRIMPPGPEADQLVTRIRELWNTDRSHVPPGMENVGTYTYYDLSS